MSASVTRDLAFVRDTELDLIASSMGVPWRCWAQAWGLGAGFEDASLVAQSASRESSADLIALDWRLFPSGSHLAAWVQVPSDWRAKLAAKLVARLSTSPLPDEDFALVAADQALADLLKRWGRILQPAKSGALDPDETNPVPSQVLVPHSGAVLLTDSASGLRCLLGRSAYQALLPKLAVPANTTAPSGLLHTLAQYRLPVTLGLGEVEIPMADLLNLQTGDVIQFPTWLSDELPLTLAANVAPTPALRCQLGQRDGHLAIKVVAKAKAA